jgi:hypothetical protein
MLPHARDAGQTSEFRQPHQALLVGGSAERLTDVIAKAHRLHNVCKSSSKIVLAIKQAVAPFPKVVEFDNRCM